MLAYIALPSARESHDPFQHEIKSTYFFLFFCFFASVLTYTMMTSSAFNLEMDMHAGETNFINR